MPTPDDRAPRALAVAPEGKEQENLDLDDVVRHINQLYAAGSLMTALKIGEFIIDTFFEGDAQGFELRRERRGAFTELKNRTDLHTSFASLYFSVRVYSQWKAIPGGFGRALSFTHHKALLPLRDVEVKVALAEQAEAERWTVKTLKAKVQKASSAARGNRGRRRTPLLRRCAADVERLRATVEALEDHSLASLFGEMDADDLYQLSDAALGDLSELQAQFRRLRVQARQRGGDPD